VSGVSPSTVETAFAHNDWATLRLLEACEGLSAEQLASSVPGTYGSILDTLRHIVGADANYLALLAGDDGFRIDEEQQAALDIAAMRATTQRHQEAWAAALSPDLDPDEPVVRHREDGSTSSAPRGLRIAQVLQHGTDHRSQICTALTNLGIEPPFIDLFSYGDAKGLVTRTPPSDAS
jgi:uncharacterized damage-inducible protein DinB